jgi:hypothetical protein
MRLCRLGSIVLGRQTPFLRHLVSDSDAGQQHLEGECGYRSERAHNSDAEQGFQANSNQLEFFGKSLVLVNHS